jgi:hypothetical protein
MKEDQIRRAMREMGSRGGKKRMGSLTEAERKALARKAAAASAKARKAKAAKKKKA